MATAATPTAPSTMAVASSRDMLRLATAMVLGAVGVAAVAKFLR